MVIFIFKFFNCKGKIFESISYVIGDIVFCWNVRNVIVSVNMIYGSVVDFLNIRENILISSRVVVVFINFVISIGLCLILFSS